MRCSNDLSGGPAGHRRVVFVDSGADRPIVGQRRDCHVLQTDAERFPGQIHRPFTVGTEASSEYRRLFEVAAELFEAVVRVLAPGRSDVDVRAAADPILERADMWTMDTLVHGWGLSIEPPRLDATERTLIERPPDPVVFVPGMALVVQPHVLSADRTRGLQVGSLVVVTDDGPEVLQRHPMQFGVLEEGLSSQVDVEIESGGNRRAVSAVESVSETGGPT